MKRKSVHILWLVSLVLCIVLGIHIIIQATLSRRKIAAVDTESTIVQSIQSVETIQDKCESSYGNSLVTRWKTNQTSYCTGSDLHASKLFCRHVTYDTLNEKYDQEAMTICQAENFMLDFSNVEKQGEFFMLQDGSFQGFCDSNLTMVKHVPKNFNKELLMQLQTYDKNPFHKCSKWVDEPLYIVKRIWPMNIYHAMTDWFNLWLAKQVMNLEKFDVLTMDDYEVLPKLDPVWTKILGASSVYTLNEKQKEGQVCYKKVIFGESGAHSMLMQSRYRVDCNNAELYKKFAREFKAKMNPAIETSTKRRITAVVRKDHGKTIMRQFQNEDEIVNALRTLDNVQVTVVDLVTLSLQEQFNLIANTDILFATHGAALTHSLFLPEDAVVVEFSPVYSWYENLVTMAGRKHLSFGTNNYFRHTIPVNIPELLSVMKKALTM